MDTLRKLNNKGEEDGNSTTDDFSAVRKEGSKTERDMSKQKLKRTKINALLDELVMGILEARKALDEAFNIPSEDMPSYTEAHSTDNDIPEDHRRYTIETANKGMQEDVLKTTFLVWDNGISLCRMDIVPRKKRHKDETTKEILEGSHLHIFSDSDRKAVSLDGFGANNIVDNVDFFLKYCNFEKEAKQGVLL